MRKWLLGCLVLSVSLGAAVAFSQGSVASSNAPLWSEKNQAAPLLLPQTPDFKSLAQQAIPAVVSIQVEQKVQQRGRMRGGQPGLDPFEFFHKYFGGEIPREYSNRGLGTGFVIEKKGLILTNYHVVENADVIEVTFSTQGGGEKKMQAKVLGTAPEYDVALLQTEGDAQASIAYLGDSDNASIGDWVMAVGNPFGLSHSVSVGIISAKERRDIAPSGRNGLYDFIQTDASINPGNSGGPLLNIRGEVVGINSAINAAGSGIGFAIPINMVKAMLPELKAKGSFARAWIGVKIQPLTPELAQSFGLKQETGALVSEIVPGGPAANAHLQEGDVILSFDGKPVRHSNDLPLFASMAGVGKSVPLKVWRNGKEMQIAIKMGAFPHENEMASVGEAENPESVLGMALGDLTPALRERLQLPEIKGVLIKDTLPGSASARAGLRSGDVIIAFDGQRYQSAQTLTQAIQKTPKGGVLRFKLLRDGSGMFIAFRKP